MRILTYGLSSDKLGGIETFLLNMNQFMHEEIVFDYIVEGKNTIHDEKIHNRGGMCFFLHPKRDVLANIRDWNNLLKERKTYSDTIYFNLYSLSWLVPVIMCRMHGYKVIVHAHNNKLHNCGIVLHALHHFNKVLLKFMKVTRLTNSSLSTDFFYGNSHAELIFNAIDTERFAFDPSVRALIRNELKIQGKNVYGFAGRLAYQKNPEFLMRVYEQIYLSDSQAVFLVCGEGELLPKMKAMAEGKNLPVFFLGAVPNIQDYYQAMDVFILPSRYEGLGLVLIEAQASGLPCVASAKVIPEDAKVTDLLEFVALKNNPEEWAKCAISKCNSNVTRSDYANRIRSSPYDIRKEANRLADVLMR